MMDKVKKIWSKMNRWHKAAIIFLLVESRLIPGAQMGFTCNDPALSYPFTGDTVTWKHLLGGIILLPLAVLLITERRFHSDTKPKKQALIWYKEYLFGVVVNQVIVAVIKLAVGAPRPHFFDTCSPNEAVTCKGAEYISQYSCSKAHWLSQSDRSFPSGHTSLALHAGLFLIYYLHKRTVHSSTITSAQVTILILSIYCGVSRMLDHRHHWWDVVGGAVVGGPVLLYTIFNLCCDFQVPTEENKSNGHSTIETDSTLLTKET